MRQYRWGISHIWRSHVTHQQHYRSLWPKNKNESHHIYVCDNTDEACHIYEGVMSHICYITAICVQNTKRSDITYMYIEKRGHVTHMYARILTRHVTYVKKSRHVSTTLPQFVSKTQKWVTSHICMRQYRRCMSHIKRSHATHLQHYRGLCPKQKKESRHKYIN